MEEINDQELLRLIRHPDSRDTGFKIIFDRYHRELYGYIRKIVITHENTDDVLQNTFMKVYKSISKFRGESSLRSWMYRIAHNESLQLIKKNKRQAAVRAEEIIPHTLFADPYFKGEKIHQLLLRAVASLPERQKQVFELKYFEEFKYGEIASMLQLTEGALKASYHHAVAKIKDFVKQNSISE
ncbi:RNA polymerase sigma factor [Membranicola marinus]|uniref:RNA polymerase sigma factor n=1 Tax=Membranihabitans marinus TaxID=1227546 RepID=A0A953L9E2_9BACT|nr:RNA polymerase sigma factor [Membranihabitans marinus]MBY5956561.1 RNA polymerase sigma factor [Membranihabitans marinus]